MTLEELIGSLTEKFRFGGFKIIGIDDKKDIMWKSKNDGYGICINCLKQNVEIFFDGHQVGYISKYNIERGLSEVDPDQYYSLIDYMTESISDDEETQKELDFILKQFLLFEKYEEAELLKNFIKLI